MHARPVLTLYFSLFPPLSLTALNTNIQEYKMSWISYLQKLRMISSPWKIPVFLRVGYPSTITAFQQVWHCILSVRFASCSFGLATISSDMLDSFSFRFDSSHGCNLAHRIHKFNNTQQKLHWKLCKLVHMEGGVSLLSLFALSLFCLLFSYCSFSLPLSSLYLSSSFSLSSLISFICCISSFDSLSPACSSYPVRQSQGTWLAGIVYNQQNVQQDRGACGTSDDVLGKPVRNTIRQWYVSK